MFERKVLLAIVLFGTMASGCGDDSTGPPSQPVTVTAGAFGCITDLTPVRRFYVGDVRGEPARAVAVAVGEASAPYPPGTILQLVPATAMVKREAGFSPRSNDWEFFALDISELGTEIVERGLDTIDISGTTCLNCHQATPETDFVCETENGCPPIPLGESGIRAVQAADPRCN